MSLRDSLSLPAPPLPVRITPPLKLGEVDRGLRACCTTVPGGEEGRPGKGRGERGGGAGGEVGWWLFEASRSISLRLGSPDDLVVDEPRGLRPPFCTLGRDGESGAVVLVVDAVVATPTNVGVHFALRILSPVFPWEASISFKLEGEL